MPPGGAGHADIGDFVYVDFKSVLRPALWNVSDESWGSESDL